MLNQMLQPLSYLAIRHPQKWKVDWLFPIVIAFVCTLCSVGEGGNSDIYRSSGPVSMLLGFFSSLPGFYIAALAAIATFGRNDIDNVLPEPTPTVKLMTRGENVLVKLTRRRFLAMLFAFLTCESIALVLYSVLFLSYGSVIAEFSLWGGVASKILILGMTFVYYVLLMQMLAATFWGLYYLGFKLHEPQ
ncbi:hypothetical protein [Pseudomonas izuensis]|uniref:Uncharacterized protein n=1 Tax=Pseudomonas izuensis TaxID=2684212 RepID=A0ABM7RZM2_9PSED|nr:hypothetical protein [Pseudomonas izuensis]BCX67938.1 hypothetical protein LAB08_R25770 [Pseudomonas izuensis]